MGPESIPGSPVVYGLPRSHWHCQLSNFDWKNFQPHAQAVAEFWQEYREREIGRSPPHLLMIGPAGTGKTHIGVGLYRAACFATGVGRCAWYHIPSLCDALKESFNEREERLDVFADLRFADFVVLDDLFGRQLTSFEIENVLFRCIDTSHRNGAAVVATTNYNEEELSTYLSAHEMSRLLENATILEFKGEDRRL